MSDTVGVMKDGRIEQLDRPEVVYQAPATRFVASFIGENNFFKGQVVGSEPGTTLVQLGPDLVLRAATTHLRGLGEEVTVAVRPEFIDIALAENGGQPKENEISCQVEDLVFTGEQLRLVARHDILGKVLVKRSTTYFEKILSGGARHLVISFPSAKAILL